MFHIKVPSPEELESIRQRKIEAAKANPNCFTHWFPVVARLGIPHPKSRVIDFPEQLTAMLVNGDEAAGERLDDIVRSIRAFGDEVGYPLFLKSGLFSGKHEWVNTCFVAEDATDEQIKKQIVWLTHLSMMFGVELSLCLVVRSFIHTEPAFHAFEGTPITPEFRLFATDGKLNGWQPYWPEHSIQKPDTQDWAERLRAISTPGPGELEKMQAWAESVTREIGGFWSVDFLRARDGSLYLIDMAEGNKSYKCEDGYQAV